MAKGAVVAGIGGALPPRAVSNTDLVEALGIQEEWIHRRTGILNRYEVDRGVSTGDLAVEAGQRALASAGRSDVEALILATTTPDHPMPATAPSVAARLGCGHVPAFDINAVCAGFVFALAVGSSLVQSGSASRVLVIGADTFSSVVRSDDPVTTPLFGDGAGAVVLRAGTMEETGALLAFDLGSDGRGADLIMVSGGGSRQRSGRQPARPEDMYFTMHGGAVFAAAVRTMAASSQSVLARLGRGPDTVDRLVAHQANARILRAVGHQLGVPDDRLVMNLDRVGNTSAASIPLALCDALADGRMASGHFTLLTAFGGGLAWGSTALTWPDVKPG